MAASFRSRKCASTEPRPGPRWLRVERSVEPALIASTPVLRAIVSGELDADRMDYLLRDSFYTGVNYGRFDLEWILQNLSAVERDEKAVLALSKAALDQLETALRLLG